MVHDNGSQVVEMTILSAQSRPGHAAHSERRHIERLHWEIHLRVYLRAIGIAPPKSFNVKAQHLERASVNNMSLDHWRPDVYFSIRSKFAFGVRLVRVNYIDRDTHVYELYCRAVKLEQQ